MNVGTLLVVWLADSVQYESLTFLDFDVLIESTGPETYQARVVNSPAGQTGPVAFRSPFSALELENFVLRIGPSRRRVRRVDSPEISTAKAFGGRLYQALFQGDLAAIFRESLSEADRRGAGVRLRLRLTGAPDLAAVPWEFLYDSSRNQFICLSERTPLIRFLEVANPPRPVAVEPPLRVLLVASSPTDHLELDIEAECAHLAQALAPMIESGQVELVRATNATVPGLHRTLRRGPWHVLHFIGHGGFDQAQQDGVLIFEDDHRRSRPLSGQDLGNLLHDHRPLALVVLNACEGARADVNDPFAGVAQGLIEKGVPAVMAMQFEITDSAAVVLAQGLYEAIADGYPIDAAVTAARKTIYFHGNQTEWATPVLYLRSTDGRLFDIAPMPATGAPAATVAAQSATARPATARPATAPPAVDVDPAAAEGRSTAPNLGSSLRGDSIVRGMRLASELIRHTLGPAGRRLHFRTVSGEYREASDAATIAAHLQPEDLRDRPGATYIAELVRDVHRTAADGAATAVVLAQAIVDAAARAIDRGAHPVALVRGVRAAAQWYVAALTGLSSQVETKEQIAALATVCSGDPTIGELIAEAMDRVGKEGVIIVEAANTLGLALDVAEGMRIDNGYLSPYFVTDPDRGEAVLDEPYILFVDDKLSPVRDLIPLLEKVMPTGRPLVVVAEDVEGESLDTLIVNKVRETFASVAVRAPGFGDRRRAMLTDLAILTGGQVGGPMSGVRLENTTLDMLGRARRVVVTEKETVFIDGRGNFDQIAGRVDHIRAEIEQSDSDFDREKLQERLAKIAGGVAVIKVGGRSEAELESRKVRIERAVRVALLAVMEGIATGGGVSLPFLASSPSAPALTGDEAAGAAIVAAALEAPLRQLAANAGFDPDQVVRSIQGQGSTFGLNVHTGRYGDLFAAGIIDAAAVLRIAIQSAVATTERYLMVA